MEPILLDFPSQFETERLLIRMPKAGDGEMVYEAIQASIEELKPWMHFAQKMQSKEEVEKNIREAQVNFLNRSDLRLLIFNKQNGDFIGSSGLHRINWNIPSFEIGYWIDSRQARKGYMAEAVEGIVNFAKNELKARRVEIRCDSLNVRSRAIPVKLNFTLEGILKNEGRSVEGEIRDTCVFAKTFDA